MTSSIFTDRDTWHVQNMMFWRVLSMASSVGQEIAKNPTELIWVARLRRFAEDSNGPYTPDIEVSNLFESAAEAIFWAQVMFDIATRIYERQIGNQEDQTWQTATIWATFDLGMLLSAAARRGTLWDKTKQAARP
jgi:hypothetical protein